VRAPDPVTLGMRRRWALGAAGIALAGVVLVLLFLPASNTAAEIAQPVMNADSEAAGKRPTEDLRT
jgi:di/tricarboxylate transporter